MAVARRVAALTLSTFVVTAALVLPAHADTPERFAGSATARALNIALLGQNVTIGSTNALANSTPAAQANGAGVLLVPGTTSTANVSGVNQVQAPPQACLLNLPLVNVLNLAAACSQARADTTNNLPTASAAAGVAAVTVNGLDLLTPIISALTPVLDQTVGSVTNLLSGLLGNLLNPLLGNLGLNTNSLVSDLVNGLKRATAIASVRLGTSTSQVTTAADKVTAVGTAQGGQVDVLPGLTLAGAPLLSIVLGSARATSELDRGTGASTPSFDPAIVTVRLGLPLLGPGVTEIPVRVGQPVDLLAGTPLAISISLGAGRTVRNPDGTVGSIADGVSVHLLNNLIGLELAHAESAVGGARAVITPPTTAPPTVLARELAKTGAPGSSWYPMAGFALLFAAYVSRRLACARR